MKDNYEDLRLLGKDFPNPTKLGKRNKIRDGMNSIHESQESEINSPNNSIENNPYKFPHNKGDKNINKHRSNIEAEKLQKGFDKKTTLNDRLNIPKSEGRSNEVNIFI